jgi:hypothetical protein
VSGVDTVRYRDEHEEDEPTLSSMIGQEACRGPS